jgi:hypothetical protein
MLDAICDKIINDLIKMNVLKKKWLNFRL